MNILTDYCTQHDRPFSYLAKMSGIPYHTLLRHRQKTNEELKKSLTFEKVQLLKKVIPNIEEVLQKQQLKRS